jgi:MoaA/NifB/PqqE/SkfB family radical SAM enzyme
MTYQHIYRSWGSILKGRRPVLSLEITNKCPLSCPGCYAYQPNHVSGVGLESVADLSGEPLIAGVLALVKERKPLALFVVGGEPLVRVKELSRILPEVCKRGILVEVITSGVIAIPKEWNRLAGLKVVVSVDGLQPEHDRRRKPATYARILQNIQGHRVVIHCTVTRQMVESSGSLAKFVEFWNNREDVEGIRVSLYTPQVGESSREILTPEARRQVVADLDRLGRLHPKLRHSAAMMEAYLNPPGSPEACTFARITDCVSADLRTPVLPCQLGGEPDCSRCGCVAAVGLHAIDRYRLPGGVPVARVFQFSDWFGRQVAWFRSVLQGKPGSVGRETSVLRGPEPVGQVRALAAYVRHDAAPGDETAGKGS